MSSLFWSRVHGGMTHFPIALVLGAAFFDALGFFLHRSPKRREFGVTGYWLTILGGLGSFGAVVSGLALSKWKVGGTGLLLRHHLFVWPAFALIVGLATWRFLIGHQSTDRGFAIYLSVMAIACGLIGTAGFFGGEMLLGR
jgi:uncharacterized membrane protein